MTEKGMYGEMMGQRGILLSPRDKGDAIPLSPRLFRKRILPKATIGYKGRTITFDEQYLNDLAQSFHDGAYDQVPFLLADRDNAHTMDPERWRGSLKDVEVTDDGLYGIFELAAPTAELVRQNPALGVSARILEGYERSDGKVFKRALNHVLGTLDPRIPGLGQWEAVNLSNGDDGLANVIDLSSTEYEETNEMTRAEKLAAIAQASDMTPEALEALELDDEGVDSLLAAFALASGMAENTADTENAVPAATELLDLDEDALNATLDGLSEDDLAALLSELDAENTGDDLIEEPGDAPQETSEETSEETSQETPQEIPQEITDEEYAALLGDRDYDNAPADSAEGVEANIDALSDDDLAALIGSLGQTPVTPDWRATEDTGKPAEKKAEKPAEAPQEARRELVGVGASTELSNGPQSAPQTIELAHQLAAVQRQLAEERFLNIKRDMVRKGVPPALLELARPVLTAGSGAAIELSNEDGSRRTVDASAIMLQVIEQTAGYIDLATERGHNFTLADDREAAEAVEDAKLAQLWGEQYR